MTALPYGPVHTGAMPSAPEQIPQQTPDTTSALADSIAISLDRISEGVTTTGRLILQGEWSAVLERAAEAATGLVVGFLPNLVSALFVGLFFAVLFRVGLRVTHGVLQRSQNVDRGLEALVMKTLRVVGWTFIVVLVLSQLGVDLSALIAGLGIAGLAVGFAAKDSIENFISGVTILLDRPFRIGDWITVGQHSGRVTNITLRSTRLRTLNQETIVFPSVHMVSTAIVNHTAGSPLRVDVPFGIAYKEDIDEVRAVVMSLIESVEDRLAPDGKHRVVTTGLNDSSVGMELHVFVRDPSDGLPLRFELTERIRKALAKADVEIPFPHLQLFIDGAQALRDTPVRIARESA